MYQTTFNVAESSIFSRSATYRLKPELSHLMFKSISIRNTDIIIDTVEGEIILSKDIYIEHFLDYRSRCPNYFDYVGPTYEIRALWKPGMYFLPIGWSTKTKHCLHRDVLIGQYTLYKTLRSYNDFRQLNDLISYPGQQYGYLVSHEGLDTQIPGCDAPLEIPYCTCGSYQMQWRYRDQFKEILGADYMPTCKHISYMNAFDKIKSRNAFLLCQQTADRIFKSIAYWYLPPENNEHQGELKALYINDQPMRSIDHWSFYKTDKPILHDEVWKFFHTALDHDYVIKHAMAIPTLREFCNSYR